MAESYSWRCPFCGHLATIREYDIHSDETTLRIENKVGRCTLTSFFIVCPNQRCKRFTLKVDLWRSKYEGGEEQRLGVNPLYSWKLIPQSDAKVLPSYVPQSIVDSYLEACAIKDLSPRASATLARRCLQGMIRDFWKISKPRLIEEIRALEDKVDPETWEAIDTVRKMGNIGAHMEKDIDLVVADLEPGEAGLLINLIETLVDEWYVARHDREERMKKMKALGQAKQVQKQGPATTP